jgi:hypothetical protein
VFVLHPVEYTHRIRDAERYKLLHGPYHPPRCRVGKWLTCTVRGRMNVCGMSDGRIPWPMTRHKRGKPFLIVGGGLVKAIRRESETAVAYWWGVTAQTVWQWRKALGVPQVNEGTARLYRDYAPERLPPEVQAKARAAANSPEANAKKATARQGKPAQPNQAKALAAGRRKNQSLEARRKRGESHRRRGTIPPAAGRPARQHTG